MYMRAATFGVGGTFSRDNNILRGQRHSKGTMTFCRNDTIQQKETGWEETGPLIELEGAAADQNRGFSFVFHGPTRAKTTHFRSFARAAVGLGHESFYGVATDCKHQKPQIRTLPPSIRQKPQIPPPSSCLILPYLIPPKAAEILQETYSRTAAATTSIFAFLIPIPARQQREQRQRRFWLPYLPLTLKVRSTHGAFDGEEAGLML
ncbi:hypothetical protein KSP40_PGU017693 [Platanthera guangdongensis]|uniref:Uncharacterized protein n=1 Tax=Platanthera guangdongensis TaxID=2320717 RepID=A0ABR2LHC2_9ASPA